MTHALRIMLTVMGFLTAFYAFRAFLGPQVWGNMYDFMFADFVTVWERHSADLWRRLKMQASSEEFRLYFAAAAVLAAIPILLNLVTVSRNVCAVIAGVFLFNLGLWYFGDGEQPPTRFTMIGVGSLLWMIVSSFIVIEDGGTGRILKRVWRRIKD